MKYEVKVFYDVDDKTEFYFNKRDFEAFRLKIIDDSFRVVGVSYNNRYYYIFKDQIREIIIKECM